MSSGGEGIGRMKTVTDALRAIYGATDCSNGVYAALGPRRSNRLLAEAVSLGLARTIECRAVDGDGFSREPEREGVGYQLTLAGYRALTALDSAGFPEGERRIDLLEEQAEDFERERLSRDGGE